MTCLCKQHCLILFIQQSHIFVVQQSPANVIALFHDGGDMEVANYPCVVLTERS